MVGDPKFWERCYEEHRDGWEIGQPAPPLERVLRARKEAPWVPTTGRALVLGCGRGHDARLLAELGLSVTAVDFAPRAIAEARRWTPPQLASRIEWRCEDLFTVPARAPASFDLVVEHASFCAIEPARRAEWFAVARRVLRPGAMLLGLFYVHGREGGPPFGATEEEVLRLAKEAHFVVLRSETPADSVTQRRNEELLVLARTKRPGESLD